jgi:isocitrate dehydrogenase
MKYEYIQVPAEGSRIVVNTDGSLQVPDRPVIPFIEGDGIGIDITPVMRKVVDAAVAKAYGGRRKIEWMEVFAGEKANRTCGSWFPDESLHALRDFVVSIDRPGLVNLVGVESPGLTSALAIAREVGRLVG